MQTSNASARAVGAGTPGAPDITLRQIAVFSSEGARLVGPIALTLPAGRWTALLGRSGAGKSSILRAIAGLAAKVEGRIATQDGAPLNGRIAWMAQDALLAPWLSVLDNVAFGSRMRRMAEDQAAAQRALTAVGLGAYGDRMPAALSGGERQRVALARTLYEERPVVLLDEPFSALDALTRDEVSTLAAERLTGRTVLHVTHDPLEAARLADRVLILSPEGDRVIEAPLSDAPAPRSADAPETFALAATLRQALGAMEAKR